ncbi:hypothetical protein [Shimia sp.]|uniref:hypothetical protein n=1 Tax=Shimia sp. TaxID=1954381 RepID=UPI003299A081
MAKFTPIGSQATDGVVEEPLIAPPARLVQAEFEHQFVLEKHEIVLLAKLDRHVQPGVFEPL